MDVECENDFVLKAHPLSLNGAVPLPPTCEPDSEKQRRIKAVADRAIEELRERRASYECGEEIPTSSKSMVQETEGQSIVLKPTPSKLEVTEEELKETVSKMRRKNMNDEEFDELWRGALGDVLGRDEVEVTKDRYVQADIPVCNNRPGSAPPRVRTLVDDGNAIPTRLPEDPNRDDYIALWVEWVAVPKILFPLPWLLPGHVA